MSLIKGVLYVVATPIGNLGDITQRGLDILSSVAIVAAEDTRSTKKLFGLLGIKQTCIAYHEHNEEKQIAVIKTYLDRGDSVALVSDAGTPLISDPGYPLVRDLRSHGYSVVPVPGVSAVISAMSVAGIATDRFTFEGFLASKSTARIKQLEVLRHEQRTMVFYESSHRIQASLQDICQVFGGDRLATVCRELTKKFETIQQSTLAELCQWIEQPNQQKGEFVIVISGYQGSIETSSLANEAMMKVLLEYLGPSQAASVAAQLTGNKKKALYQIALQLKES